MCNAHVKRLRVNLAVLCVMFGLAAHADPQPGRAFPTFAVNDLAGNSHTQRDLAGRWTVLFVMSDKDTHPAISPWYRRVRQGAPEARLITMAALDLFPLIPTATVVSQARDNTPRARWSEVWLSRDGSLAASLGLPESEIPWVFVVSPAGRVVEAVHGTVDDASVARVLAALPSRAAPVDGAPLVTATR